MGIAELIGAASTVAISSGGIAAWYKRSAGQDALDLAGRVNAMQKEENAILEKKLIAAQAQLDIKDSIIERLVTDAKDNSRKKR